MPVFAWTAAAAATEFYDGQQDDGYAEVAGASATPKPVGEDDTHATPHHSITQVMEGGNAAHKVSTWQCGVILFKSCFGVGILGLPFAFRNSGMVAGVLSCIFVAIMTNISTKLLVWNKRLLVKRTGKEFTSIPEMSGHLFGNKGLQVANGIILCCQLGTCIAYNIFLGVSLVAIISTLYPNPDHFIYGNSLGYNPYIFFVICQTLLFCMMAQLKDVASMAPLLMFAQVAMVTAFALIIIAGMVHPSVCDRDGSTAVFCKVHAGARWDTYPVFIGIAVFAMEGIPTVLTIENSMADPDRFEEMFDRVQFLITTVFIFFGTMGYWLYGNNTKSVITLNIPGTWGIVIKMLMVIVIFLSYPLQFMPVVEICKKWADGTGFDMLYNRTPPFVKDKGYLGRTKADFSERVKFCLTIMGVLTTGIVAISIPHFGHVLSILGSVTFSAVTFVIPPILFLRAKQGEHTVQMVMLCCFIVSMGFCITGLGLWSNVSTASVWKHKFEKSPPRVGSHEVTQAHDMYKEAEGL
eukprot:CAMPEP_0181293090 /NCGR_PEP_ID=MMETSP1101-20121128/2874_1 /TAXON_ID=46948 /ORGANISM="Rhodomonas abbreviata, Strain Caron Lab Isolate" /LENGTH=521 /DNA_ID=CAMNT_0023397643 /DNA_START=92 /DNA_END=1654 /DNA_ORIENTATION=+